MPWSERGTIGELTWERVRHAYKPNIRHEMNDGAIFLFSIHPQSLFV
jgi:hypothetical protein